MSLETGIEEAVITRLDELAIAYELIKIDPDFADTAEFCREYGYALDVSGNTIVVASKRGPKLYSACVLLATDRLDVNKTVKTLMGVSRVSFAAAEETVALTGMAVGGVTPFALPADLQIYADEKLLSAEYLILGSGSRSSKIKLAANDLRKLPNPGLSVGA